MEPEDNFQENLDKLVKELIAEHQSYDLSTHVEDQHYPVAGQDITKSVYHLWLYSEKIPDLYVQYLKTEGISVEKLKPKPVGDGEKHNLLFDGVKSEEIPNFNVNRVDITLDISKHRSVFAMLGNAGQYETIKEKTNEFFNLIKNSMEKYS